MRGIESKTFRHSLAKHTKYKLDQSTRHSRMLFTIRFRKRFLHARDENDAMVKLEKAIRTLANEMSKRGVDDDKVNEIKNKVRKCDFLRVLRDYIMIFKADFKDDLKMVELVLSALTATSDFYDLRFTRMMKDLSQAIRSSFSPAWYVDHHQRKVEHTGNIVNFCHRKVKIFQHIRCQLKLKRDDELMNQMERDIIAYVWGKDGPPKLIKQLSAIKEEEEECEASVELSSCRELVVYNYENALASIGSEADNELILFQDSDDDSDSISTLTESEPDDDESIGEESWFTKAAPEELAAAAGQQYEC